MTIVNPLMAAIDVLVAATWVLGGTTAVNSRIRWTCFAMAVLFALNAGVIIG